MTESIVEKICSKCKECKSGNEFYPNRIGVYGLQSWCKKCSNAATVISTRKRRLAGLLKPVTPEENWAIKLKYRYSLSVSDYESLFAQQSGVCAICQSPQQTALGRLGVDHHHGTGTVRGLLCNRCNSALGLFQENILFLQAAIDYLSK